MNVARPPRYRRADPVARLGHPVRKLLIAIVCGAALFGCSPDSYQRSADRQVAGILRDRERETIGYTPQAKAETTAEVKLPPKAYDKIPATPIPPPAPPPIEPSHVELEAGPLG